MRQGLFIKFYLILFIIIFSPFAYSAELSDPLPSWNNGANKQSIIDFVQAVTDQTSKDYVKPENRIATIDNDGTLWVEQPMYANAIFMKTVFPNNNTNVSVEDFNQAAKQWLQSAINPHFKRHYTDLIYQPMLEVINYLQANQFDVYIVSGGGQDFIRAFSEDKYRIEPEKVIGSTVKTKYIYQNGKPTLIKLSEPLFISNYAGKAEAINLFIGKKPIIAFGNSDGDQQMLEWTQSGPGKRVMFLVHHDDAKREYAYDTKSKVGTFSETLFAEAKKDNWHVISMKNDWKVIFPFELRVN